MMPCPGRAAAIPGRRAAAAAMAVALLLSGFGLAGCRGVTAVSKVRHDVASNKATIDEFTNTLKSGEGTTFAATYVTTGSSPSTVVYAVKPPNGLAFKDTPSGTVGGSSTDLIVNSSGEYSCSPPGSMSAPTGPASASWTCRKLGAVDAAAQNKIFGFYTPAHWVAFLRDFSLAAGFAGDSITSSHLTVNGFSMRCVDFHTPGVTGTSLICTTAQGILGYVKVATDSTTFEIKSYSGSPPASLFDLPPGAKVTAQKTGTA
jgi:hypothetical protein